MAPKASSKKSKNKKAKSPEPAKKLATPKIPKKTVKPKVLDPATQYAHDVVKGKILGNKRLIQQCQRHLDDLKRDDLYFDLAAAQDIYDYAEEMPLVEGTFYLKNPDGSFLLDENGRKVKQTHLSLLPWQKFLFGSIFGWKKKSDGTRRFRNAFVFVPRKNGKTTIAAIPISYLTFMDGEMGAQGYTVGTKYDQARILHGVIEKTLERTELREHLKFSRAKGHECIADPVTKSVLKPLASDHKTLDGLNPYALAFDEVHAYEDKGLYYVLEEAMTAREQPLIMDITTAGVYNPNGICQERYDYACAVLDKVHDDDTFFALIYEADPGDDWQDERVWHKCNPSLGLSKFLDKMQDERRKALRSETKKSTFLTKQLNVWVQAVDKYISVADWKQCAELDNRSIAEIEQSLKGRRCYGGWDMASSLDLASFVLIFPAEDDPEGLWRCLMRCWCPDNQIQKRARGDGARMAPYDVWANAGFIQTTDGDVINPDFILEEIRSLATAYDIREIAYDAAQCRNEAIRLQNDGLTLYEFYQSAKNFNEPMNKLNDFLKTRKFSHGNHPALTWQANNVVAAKNVDGLIKPDKKNAREKIDSMVALYMGLQRALMNQSPTVDTSIVWL